LNIATRIHGVGAYIPERKITNEDVIGMLRLASAAYLPPEDLVKLIEKAKSNLAKTGNSTRYWCRENEYCTDIARIAAERALDDAEIDPKDVDLLIFTGMSKAFVEPATGHVLRHELGLVNANVIDTQDACTSFIKSMEIANSHIKSGAYKTVLIAAGERSYDWADFTCKTIEDLAWKFGSLTIGDAAGAMVLQSTDDPEYTQENRHMRFYFKIADGTFLTCHIGLNYRFGTRYRLNSHSSRLINTGLQMVMELLFEILEQDLWKGIEYDNLFIHDIGKIIDDMVLPMIRQANICVPDTYKSFFPKYGNIASATLPVSLYLAKQDGRLKRGNLVVYVCPSAGVQAGVSVFRY
jgi:3-oxoacyl-[acyl-carrier-protein] synthase-3